MADDILGREINIGNYISFIEPAFKKIIVGKVVETTEKQVRIKYKMRGGSFGYKTTRSSQVTLLEDSKYLIMYLLKNSDL